MAGAQGEGQGGGSTLGEKEVGQVVVQCGGRLEEFKGSRGHTLICPSLSFTIACKRG